MPWAFVVITKLSNTRDQCPDLAFIGQPHLAPDQGNSKKINLPNGFRDAVNDTPKRLFYGSSLGFSAVFEDIS
jgi:hypothetical protein